MLMYFQTLLFKIHKQIDIRHNAASVILKDNMAATYFNKLINFDCFVQS